MSFQTTKFDNQLPSLYVTKIFIQEKFNSRTANLLVLNQEILQKTRPFDDFSIYL